MKTQKEMPTFSIFFIPSFCSILWPPPPASSLHPSAPPPYSDSPAAMQQPRTNSPLWQIYCCRRAIGRQADGRDLKLGAHWAQPDREDLLAGCDLPPALFEVSYGPGADRMQKRCQITVIKTSVPWWEGRVGVSMCAQGGEMCSFWRQEPGRMDRKEENPAEKRCLSHLSSIRHVRSLHLLWATKRTEKPFAETEMPL